MILIIFLFIQNLMIKLNLIMKQTQNQLQILTLIFATLKIKISCENFHKLFTFYICTIFQE